MNSDIVIFLFNKSRLICPKLDKFIWIIKYCRCESVWPSATCRKQVAHWVRSEASGRNMDVFMMDGAVVHIRFFRAVCLPEKRPFFWKGGRLQGRNPRKGPFFWTGRWQTKKRHPRKDVSVMYSVKDPSLRSGWQSALRMTVYNYLLSAVATSTAQATLNLP